MNRVKRDYCNKKYHPRWRAWKVKYLNEKVAPYGMYVNDIICSFCGVSVSNTRQIK